MMNTKANAGRAHKLFRRQIQVIFVEECQLTWPQSHVHALQEGLGGVDAGLDAFGRSQVSLLQGSDVSFRQVHVILVENRQVAVIK